LGGDVDLSDARNDIGEDRALERRRLDDGACDFASGAGAASDRIG
jgi:hypothetical protein